MIWKAALFVQSYLRVKGSTSGFVQPYGRAGLREYTLAQPLTSTLEIAMTERAFTSYKEANAYAKQLAKKRGGVSLVRNGSEYIVKLIASTGSSAQVKLEHLSLEPKTQQTAPSIPTASLPTKSAKTDHLRIECGVVIPHARIVAMPTVSRCVKCQSAFENSYDTRPHINEGIAGTRDENKKMRGQLRGDMRNRGRGS